MLRGLGMICLMLMGVKLRGAQQTYVAVKEFKWTATTATVCTNTWRFGEPLKSAVQLSTLHPS